MVVGVDGVEVMYDDVSVLHFLPGVFDGVDGVGVETGGASGGRSFDPLPPGAASAAAGRPPSTPLVGFQALAHLVHRRRHVLKELHRGENWKTHKTEKNYYNGYSPFLLLLLRTEMSILRVDKMRPLFQEVIVTKLAVTQSTTRYQMNAMDIIFPMIPHESLWVRWFRHHSSAKLGIFPK